MYRVEMKHYIGVKGRSEDEVGRDIENEYQIKSIPTENDADVPGIAAAPARGVWYITPTRANVEVEFEDANIAGREVEIWQVENAAAGL